MRKHPFFTLLSVAALAALLNRGSVKAGFIQITSPSGLSASDSTLVYPDAVGSHYTGSVSYTTAGETLTFSRPNSPLERDQAGNNYFNTAFANGTQILYAGGFSGTGAGGPITLLFSQPVSEVGFGMEEFNFVNYRVTFTAFEGTTALGTFTASGNDPNQLSFIGVQAFGGDFITSLQITDDAIPAPNLGFGPITFGPAAPVSEPSSLTLLGLGALGLLGYARRRRIRRLLLTR